MYYYYINITISTSTPITIPARDNYFLSTFIGHRARANALTVGGSPRALTSQAARVAVGRSPRYRYGLYTAL